MIKKFDAWAIETEKEPCGLIGRYWRFDNKAPISLPVHLEGCRFALFTTRRLARENLPSLRRLWPKARVVHVTITIDEFVRKG